MWAAYTLILGLLFLLNFFGSITSKGNYARLYFAAMALICAAVALMIMYQYGIISKYF